MSDSDRILVAYGSRHGATAEIATAIGEQLRAAGFDVEVQPAGGVRSLAGYRTVILGSAVYAGRWRADALRLLRRPELRDLDVWLFSSGPVGPDDGDPARAERWTVPAAVRRLAADNGAHEHAVFGGMVAEDAGMIRRRLARKLDPDLRDRRDFGEIAAWADAIAASLAARR